MTYYVVASLKGSERVCARLTDDPEFSDREAPVLLVGEEFDQTVLPSQVLWVDGSEEARELAEEGGYKTLGEEDSRWNVMKAAILKDRAAAGGRATKGVVSPRKLRAVRRNGKLGGRPVETQQ